MDYERQYVDLKQKIISQAFPELVTTSIDVVVRNCDSHLAVIPKENRKYLVEINRDLTKAPLQVVEGGLAHELAHVYFFTQSGPLSQIIEACFSHFQFYETWDERRADRLVIDRGFGSQLLAFTKYINKRFEDYTAEDGLTVQEIEALIRAKKKK